MGPFMVFVSKNEAACENLYKCYQLITTLATGALLVCVLQKVTTEACSFFCSVLYCLGIVQKARVPHSVKRTSVDRRQETPHIYLET